MIRKSIHNTKLATYSIDLPNDKGTPAPTGTGFFVSADGWFVTAAHVVTGQDGKPRHDDVAKGWLPGFCVAHGSIPLGFGATCGAETSTAKELGNALNISKHRSCAERLEDPLATSCAPAPPNRTD